MSKDFNDDNIDSIIPTEPSGSDLKLLIRVFRWVAKEQADGNKNTEELTNEVKKLNDNFTTLLKYFKETGEDNFEGKLKSTINKEMEVISEEINTATKGIIWKVAVLISGSLGTLYVVIKVLLDSGVI